LADFPQLLEVSPHSQSTHKRWFWVWNNWIFQSFTR